MAYSVDITRPSEDEENLCSCQKIFFVIFNALYWMVSIGILGLAIWQAAGAPVSFNTGTSPFTYSMMAIGVLGFGMCIMGFIMTIFEYLVLTGSYIIVFVILMATQIGLILGCGALYPTPTAVIQQLWTESSPYMLEQAASNLQCCGYSSWNDTYDTVDDVPAGCVNENNYIFVNGCGDLILTYFTTAPVFSYFVTVITFIALIQILTLVGACLLFYAMWQDLRTKESQRNFSRNKIVPIMINPIDKDSPKVSSSAASRADIALDVSTPAQSNKGNEALVRVAGAMLE